MNARLAFLGTWSFALAALCLLAGCAGSSQPEQLTFDTPEDAANALHQATLSRDRDQLERIFGPELAELASGSEQQDDADFQRFSAAFERKWELEKEPDGRLYLAVGEQGWVFPAPMVNENGRWRFDTEQGIEAIYDRRIGQNELSAIRACNGYVRAQQAYFEMDPDGDGVKTFAQKLRSTPGQRDGLWWPDSPDAPQSPLGPLVAAAVSRGEAQDFAEMPAERQPYRGYYFKPLVRQGASANGGEKQYVDSEGRMTGGFALIAWPAEYGITGVMSFIVSQDGVIFERDLGEQTAQIAEQTEAFDPGEGWIAIQPG